MHLLYTGASKAEDAMMMVVDDDGGSWWWCIWYNSYCVQCVPISKAEELIHLSKKKKERR